MHSNILAYTGGVHIQIIRLIIIASNGNERKRNENGENNDLHNEHSMSVTIFYY